MKYNQPYDQTDPNAPYINGNPSAGTAGSIPPAAQMEYPQREIVYAITQAGFTPTNADLTQLWQAIQKSGSDYINTLSIVGGRTAIFNTTGTITFPAKVTKARVIGQAGGGGGGGGNGYAGAGGLGGNSFEGVFNVTAGVVYVCTIGAAGASGGGGGGGAPGGNGGLTAFGPQGGTALAYALGGTGGSSGGNPSTGNVGITGAPPGLSAISFPNGGYELAGGGAQNGIILPGSSVNFGGIGGGARFSPTTPFPVGNGRFNANGFGGGGSGGAGSDVGGMGAPGLIIIEY